MRVTPVCIDLTMTQRQAVTKKKALAHRATDRAGATATHSDECRVRKGPPHRPVPTDPRLGEETGGPETNHQPCLERLAQVGFSYETTKNPAGGNDVRQQGRVQGSNSDNF